MVPDSKVDTDYGEEKNFSSALRMGKLARELRTSNSAG